MRNEVLDLFAINFINNHFDEIDLQKVEWNVKTKKQAIKDMVNYEWNEMEETHWLVDFEITHWTPLPELPIGY